MPIQSSAEQVVKDELEAQGFEVLRSGWPDFLAVNHVTRQVRLIEVKGSGDFVKPNQQKLHEVLKMAGLTVEVIQFGVPGRPPETRRGPTHRPKGTGSIYRPPGSRFYWIAYMRDGKRFAESTKSTVKQVAQDILTSRLSDVLRQRQGVNL